jgi:hypothetical protein
MGRQFNEDNLTAEVVKRFGKTKDKRFREIMTSAVKHLHAFARETKLTEEEWFEGIKFLTQVGQKCDDKRQEFILLSDVLGLSMMVVALNHKTAPGATEATVLGPFFAHGAKEYGYGADLREGRDDEGRGRVGLRQGDRHRRQGDPERRARYLAGQSRRYLRPADRGRIRAARSRQGQRQGRIRIRELQAEVLLDPDRRPGRRHGQRHDQEPHAAGAHARHRLRARLSAGDHARVRRW